MNTLCLVLSHNYVITINQYLNQCLHLVLFACILSDEKARKTFYKKVAMCSDGGEWRDNFHFSSNNAIYIEEIRNIRLPFLRNFNSFNLMGGGVTHGAGAGFYRLG